MLEKKLYITLYLFSKKKKWTFQFQCRQRRRLGLHLGLHNDSDVFDSIFRHGPGFTRELVLFNFNHKAKARKKEWKGHRDMLQNNSLCAY